MLTIIFSLFSSARQAFHTRTALQAESQPLILHRSSRGHRLSLSRADRFLRGWLAGFWSGWRSALVIVKPETVLASQGIPTVLEVEESPSERTTLRVTGSHRSHSSDELGESWRRNPLYGAATKILAPVSNNMAQTKVDLNFFAALS